MKKFWLIALLGVTSFTGCLKNEKGCVTVKPEAEDTQMVAYASATGMTVTKHSSGLYYEVITAGTGASPSASSRINIRYTGKLLNGTTFDQAAIPVWFNLNQLIEGWQIGVPLVKKGGKVRLIIPSSLGYGCNAVGSIPANSVLYFDIDLVDVQ